MTTDPLSSPEAVVQLIQNIQTADYAGLSAAIMFIWDYGGPTSRILSNDSLNVWLSIGPVTMLDKEVGPNPLSRINDARFITLYIRLIISGRVSFCHSFQCALILSDRTEEKTLEMWAFPFLRGKMGSSIVVQIMYLIVRYNVPWERH